MSPGGEDRLWIGAGALALALIVIFVLAAFSALLVDGAAGAGSSPPGFYLLRVTLFTIGQAVVSTTLALAFALPVALAMARRPQFFGRKALVALMVLPLGLPVLPAVFGIVEIWGRQGVVPDMLGAVGLGDGFSIYGLAGILIAHVFFNLPLAARLMLRALSQIPAQQWRLAASLDFSRIRLFRLVEWPAVLRVLPGIAGLVFMLCVTSFTIVLTLGGGPAASTLEVAIYQALKFDYDPPRALLLCFLQFCLTAIVFLLLSRFPEPEEDHAAEPGAPFRPDAATLSGRLTDMAVTFLFAAFVASPLIAVVLSGLSSDLGHLFADHLFWRSLETSVLIALAAGLSSTALTYFMLRARLLLRKSGAAISVLFRLPEFMLLVPPLALGAGWFLILLRAGIEGVPAALMVVAINAIMAMPFTSRVLWPEMLSHAARTSRLAESLDIGGLDRILLIDWPVLKAPLLSALSFAMALSLGDLGAIALFGSDDLITLPSLLYAKLGSYRSTDAAGLSLILGALCLLLMLPALRADQAQAETRV